MGAKKSATVTWASEAGSELSWPASLGSVSSMGFAEHRLRSRLGRDAGATGRERERGKYEGEESTSHAVVIHQWKYWSV